MKRVFAVGGAIWYGSCKPHMGPKASRLMFAPIFISLFIFIFIFISLFIFISIYFAILLSHRQALAAPLATCAGVGVKR